MRYADELVERLGHVPGVQQFALHLHAHMRARLGEFEGALEALSDVSATVFASSARNASTRSPRAASGTSAAWSGDGRSGARAYARLRADRATGEGTYLSTSRRLTLSRPLPARQGRRGRHTEARSAKSERCGHGSTRPCKRAAGEGLMRRARRAGALPLTAGGGRDARANRLLRLAADTWLCLAEVLRAAGGADAAEAAQNALARYEQKGNLVGAERARAILGATRGLSPSRRRCTVRPTQSTLGGRERWKACGAFRDRS